MIGSVGDLPFGSYESTDEIAVTTSRRFMDEAGCDAVKLEGAGAMLSRITRGHCASASSSRKHEVLAIAACFGGEGCLHDEPCMDPPKHGTPQKLSKLLFCGP